MNELNTSIETSCVGQSKTELKLVVDGLEEKNYQLINLAIRIEKIANTLYSGASPSNKTSQVGSSEGNLTPTRDGVLGAFDAIADQYYRTINRLEENVRYIETII